MRPLVTVHDVGIFKPSTPIQNIDDTVRNLSRDMIDTMYYNDGIGLAGNQIGVFERIFVMDIPKITNGAVVCINPELVRVSRGTVISSEGCLSIPKFFHKVPRRRSVVLEYTDLEGKRQTMEATDLLAICIQHECDHLEGKLFLHNVPRPDWPRVNRLLKKKEFPGFLE